MTRPDAVERLCDDHQRLLRWLESLLQARSIHRRQRLLARVEEDLREHLRLEDRLFYPQCQRVALTRRIYESFEQGGREHHHLAAHLSALGQTGASSSEFVASAAAFHEALARHFRWEETTLFVAARRGLGRAGLLEVAQLMPIRMPAPRSAVPEPGEALSPRVRGRLASVARRRPGSSGSSSRGGTRTRP